MEYRLRRHDGVYRWIFDRGTPSFDDAGTFLGFIGSCVDIDDRRRAQAEREQAQLADAHSFEKWILGIVGHDIRNPLGAIDLAARVLQKSPDPTVVARTAERVLRGVDRITHIVSDLLDLSRERHGGGIPVSRAECNLQSICRQVIDELAASAKERSDRARLRRGRARRVGLAPADAGDLEPRRQRRAAQPGRLADRRRDRRARRRGRGRGAQPGTDSARDAAGDLRRVPLRRREGRARSGPRARPVHRPGDHARPRRAHRGHLDGGRGHQVLRACCRGARPSPLPRPGSYSSSSSRMPGREVRTGSVRSGPTATGLSLRGARPGGAPRARARSAGASRRRA